MGGVALPLRDAFPVKTLKEAGLRPRVLSLAFPLIQSSSAYFHVTAMSGWCVTPGHRLSVRVDAETVTFLSCKVGLGDTLSDIKWSLGRP